ncbi:MAG: hypothetical protein AB7F86_15015 [Bdellovibrionales bacterium]
MTVDFLKMMCTFSLWLLLYALIYMLAQAVLFNLVRIVELVRTCALIAVVVGILFWTAFYLLANSTFESDAHRAVLAWAGLFGSLGFSGTYIVLGPLSADRSLSAHMCILMFRSGGRMKEQELLNIYSQSVVFQKRFSEYDKKGVMKREGGDLILTARGARIAKFFAFILKMLNMKENF